MKITLRLIVSLVLAAAVVVGLFSYTQVQNEKERLKNELDDRAITFSESLQESVRGLVASNSRSKLKKLAGRFAGRDRLLGVAVFDSLGYEMVSSSSFISAISDSAANISESIVQGQGVSTFETVGGKLVLLRSVPLFSQEKTLGAMLVVYDATYIGALSKDIWETNFVRLLIQAVLIILIIFVVVRLNITGPIAQAAIWMKSLRTGKADKPDVEIPRGDILKPLADEVVLMAKSLAAARLAAHQQNVKPGIQTESFWSSERLKEFMHHELEGKHLLVVSNREPFMHIRNGSLIECIIPAGGLVTALEPVLRACGGVWIALGSGDADRETSDSKGKLLVPPEDPSYELRRVFISKQEEEGYYYGFSNEGLWPLCHITHTRPTFRLEDWINYQKVNQKFADVLLDEIAGDNEPLILIQDYHFALLPLLIKSKRPDARIAIFWHIPWPNPEVIGICPWKQEILMGLLGADLIGFHIQFHCNNFLETVDRFLESKINWDQFSIERKGNLTSVRPFPISIAFPEPCSDRVSFAAKRKTFKDSALKKIGVSADIIAVGVDRIDYTKGILERFKAVERFLEKYPDYIGRFTFVELGAPSRTHIKRYHDLIAELDETVDKINWRFQSKDWKPVVFLKAHHNHEEINKFYIASDVCMVTSLHDGMNLVAKEFIASREDDDGVLILSQFTGAAGELQDALIINPYSTEEMADAIFTALIMDNNEKAQRMHRMREMIKERNVYRWAANMVTALSRLRISNSHESEPLIK